MNAASNHPAELADRHASLFGAAIVLVALKFAVSAAMHFTDGSTTSILDTVELVLALVAAAVVLAVFGSKVLRLTAEQRRAHLDEDSFVLEAIRRSSVTSWNASVLALVILEIFADDADSIAADFFLQVALAILLGVFGLKFFALMRDPGGDDDA